MPFLSFRSGYSLRSHLVRAKVYPEISVKLPLTCRLTLLKVLLPKKFTKLIIIFIVCGLQYIRSTVERFRLRWHNYNCSQRIASEGGTELPNKITSIKILWVRTTMDYLRIVRFKKKKKFTKLIIIFIVCGLQYVGSTVDRFRLRWHNYKCSQRIASEGGTVLPNKITSINILWVRTIMD